jgi:hypothetical protein
MRVEAFRERGRPSRLHFARRRLSSVSVKRAGVAA